MQRQKTLEKAKIIKEMINSGCTLEEIRNKFKCTRYNVYKLLKMVCNQEEYKELLKMVNLNKKKKIIKL